MATEEYWPEMGRHKGILEEMFGEEQTREILSNGETNSLRNTRLMIPSLALLVNGAIGMPIFLFGKAAMEMAEIFGYDVNSPTKYVIATGLGVAFATGCYLCSIINRRQTEANLAVRTAIAEKEYRETGRLPFWAEHDSNLGIDKIPFEYALRTQTTQ